MEIYLKKWYIFQINGNKTIKNDIWKYVNIFKKNVQMIWKRSYVFEKLEIYLKGGDILQKPKIQAPCFFF
jgi:hypothetical protein